MLRPLTSSPMIQATLSSGLGAAFGFLVSLVVNSALVELFFNSYITTVFGSLYLLLSLIMGHQMYKAYKVKNLPFNAENVISAFTTLVVFISGAGCFYAKTESFSSLSPVGKAPL